MHLKRHLGHDTQPAVAEAEAIEGPLVEIVYLSDAQDFHGAGLGGIHTPGTQITRITPQVGEVRFFKGIIHAQRIEETPISTEEAMGYIQPKQPEDVV